MLNFFKFYIYIFILIKYIINIFLYDNFNLFYNFYIIYFFIFFYLNYFLSDGLYKKNLKIDIYFKYFIFFFKKPSFFVNYFIITFKKIFLYLFFFKYKILINSIKIFTRKYYNNILLIWKPIFKKSSYFGYYRSNRSKWIK